MKRRFAYLFGSAAAAAALLGAGALWYIAAEGTPLRLHLVVSVLLAVTLSLLLAAGLMGLMFLSNESGHDRNAADEAAKQDPESWRDDR